MKEIYDFNYLHGLSNKRKAKIVKEMVASLRSNDANVVGGYIVDAKENLYSIFETNKPDTLANGYVELGSYIVACLDVLDMNYPDDLLDIIEEFYTELENVTQKVYDVMESVNDVVSGYTFSGLTL